MRLLGVSDRVEEALRSDDVRNLRPDLVVSCGDLPFDYLGWLGDVAEAPVVFVPGNHDPDVSGYRTTRGGLVIRAGLPATPPWPLGAANADGRVLDIGGLRIVGLGGSPRYRDGPNQYGEREQGRRARRVVLRARWATRGGRQPVDLVVFHTPPLGVGDQDDPLHRGFRSHVIVVRRLRPRLVLHGHVDPVGGLGSAGDAGRALGGAQVVNVTGHRLLDLVVGGR